MKLFASTKTDAKGNFKVQTKQRVSGMFGIFTEISASGYATTSSYLAWRDVRTNVYPAANHFHDAWLVPKKTLDAWNKTLAKAADGKIPVLGKSSELRHCRHLCAGGALSGLSAR